MPMSLIRRLFGSSGYKEACSSTFLNSAREVDIWYVLKESLIGTDWNGLGMRNESTGSLGNLDCMNSKANGLRKSPPNLVNWMPFVSTDPLLMGVTLTISSSISTTMEEKGLETENAVQSCLLRMEKMGTSSSSKAT
ncbi:hypothetical protein OGATHE_001814 [Ogataea polymorpha]|uniref:Uncharacterized protein n=1 Tax=Ogataea polymorpha TaxID=460523 RepID=A0A9P8TCM2_9ASCO|nr:hypothetical protein OGATHE_001814 [Ogataea polymorpha]